MRLALYDSFFLPVVSALRSEGVDAHVFIDRRDVALSAHLRDDPRLRDPSVHIDDFVTRSTLLAPWRSPLVPVLRSFDAVIAAGLGPVFAPFAGVPWVFHPLGGDLTVTPFPLRAHLAPARERLRNTPTAVWQRRGIRRSASVWSGPWDPYKLALGRLGAKPGPYVPVPVEAERFTAHPEPPPPAWPDADLVVFHPARLILRRHPRLVETGHWKANDRLLEGFAMHVRASGSRSVLVLVDRPQSPDRVLARDLVRSLGIGDHVVWLQHPSEQGFSWNELPAMYRAADVVADDFGVGWFGLVTLEGLAAGRPVMTYVKPDVMRGLYSDHPLTLAHTPEEIASRLDELRDPTLRAVLGDRGRAWVGEHHSPAAVAARYLETLGPILS